MRWFRLPSGSSTPPRLGAESLWQNYLDLRRVREQNQDLQKTIDRLRLEQAALLEDARQGQRLQALLDFQQKYIYKTLAAQAIGSSGSDRRGSSISTRARPTAWTATWR